MMRVALLTPPILTMKLNMYICIHIYIHIFPDSLVGKGSTCNAGDPGSIPGSGRSPG